MFAIRHSWQDTTKEEANSTDRPGIVQQHKLKKDSQYPHAVFVEVLDDGMSLFFTQALETTNA